MVRLFGTLTLLAFCGMIGYAIEGNPIGIAVFAIFTLIFAMIWLAPRPENEDH